MKKSKTVLIESIKRECLKNIKNKKLIQEEVNFAMANYNLPVSISSDIFTLRTDLSIYTEFILFCILSTICKIDNTSSARVDEFYTDKEVAEYSKTKYKKEIVEFPIKWEMVQIRENQWIGKITMRELMQLRDAQLIYYNENTQRTLKHKIENGNEYQHIAINKNAVKEIAKSMKENGFIPNTITLNIPEDGDIRYEDGILIIDNIEAFDILDGYHRYLGGSENYNLDKDFDYSMELRVVCFDEDTARRFIYQENKKTKMKLVDAESFNQDKPSNLVIKKINQNTIYNNKIKTAGILDPGVVSNLITYYYFKGKKTATNKEVCEVRDIVINMFESVMESKYEIFDERWDPKLIVLMFVVYNNEENHTRTLEKMEAFREYLLKDKANKIILSNAVNTLSNTNFTKLNSLYGAFKEV